MARLVRGCQQIGCNERYPQWEEQPDTGKGKGIGNYNPNIDYEGIELGNEPVIQEQREVDSDAEYAKIEMPQNGTLHKRMMSWDVYMGILWVQREQGPDIMALWLQYKYIRLGFSPEAAKLLIREQGLDSPGRL